MIMSANVLPMHPCLESADLQSQINLTLKLTDLFKAQSLFCIFMLPPLSTKRCVTENEARHLHICRLWLCMVKPQAVQHDDIVVFGQLYTSDDQWSGLVYCSYVVDYVNLSFAVRVMMLCLARYVNNNYVVCINSYTGFFIINFIVKE